MTTFYANQAGTWTAIASLYANVMGTWTNIKSVWQNQAGTWVQVWLGLTPITGSISPPGYTQTAAPNETKTFSHTITLSGGQPPYTINWVIISGGSTVGSGTGATASFSASNGSAGVARSFNVNFNAQDSAGQNYAAPAITDTLQT